MTSISSAKNPTAANGGSRLRAQPGTWQQSTAVANGHERNNDQQVNG
jgi:hypothetical protein